MHWPGAGVALTISALLTVAVFIPFMVTQALKDKENQVHNFSMLIFILAFMAVNIMVFALKVSKNVLSSMVVTAIDNMATHDMIEARNALMLESLQNDQAKLIAEKSDALDQKLQMLMVDILLATHEDNRAAVAMDNEIDLKKANYFDVHNSTELVIFGNEISEGKGEELQADLEEYKELLLGHAGSGLDDALTKMLYTGPMGEYQQDWLEFTFYQTPMISALNILSNYQLKIRFLEGEVLREIMAEDKTQ
jgi:hypothetical protein